MIIPQSMRSNTKVDYVGFEDVKCVCVLVTVIRRA